MRNRVETDEEIQRFWFWGGFFVGAGVGTTVGWIIGAALRACSHG